MESLPGEITVSNKLIMHCFALKKKKNHSGYSVFLQFPFYILGSSSLGFAFVPLHCQYLGVQQNLSLSTVFNLLAGKMLSWYTQHLH